MSRNKQHEMNEHEIHAVIRLLLYCILSRNYIIFYYFFMNKTFDLQEWIFQSNITSKVKPAMQ